MNPTMPTPAPAPINLPAGPSGNRSLLPILTVVFVSIGAIIFAILAIYFFSQAQTAQNNLDKAKITAADSARNDQKLADAAAALAIAESPYSTYTAPTEYGAFEVHYPKNWLSNLQLQASGDQVVLWLSPQMFRRINGVDDLFATKVVLKQQPTTQYLAQYQTNKKLKLTKRVISGQDATEITGDFSDKRTTKIVAVPVRDKTLIFINEDAKSAKEFEQILAQSKIVP